MDVETSSWYLFLKKKLIGGVTSKHYVDVETSSWYLFLKEVEVGPDLTHLIVAGKKLNSKFRGG